MNTIVSFKDLLDLSTVSCKMHSRYDITICWCFTLAKLSAKPWCSLQIKLPTSIMLNAVQANRGWPLFSYFSKYIAAVDFVQQFVQTSSAKHVTVNSS